MPEAPEVQTVLTTLQNQIKDLEIIDVEVYYPKLIDNMSVEDFKNIVHQHFCSFDRIGKYMIFGLNQYDLIVHLRMEGKFYLEVEKPTNKHIHAIFALSDGRYLCYHDTRKFGRMYLYDRTDTRNYECFKHVGHDYLDKCVDGKYLYDRIHHQKRPIKLALLDQSIIAGIGNIYADEILFACGIDPRITCDHLSLVECDDIVNNTIKILTEATKYGGTTIRSYTSSLHVTGRFQQKLNVHAQTHCRICGSEVYKIKVGQRGTYICPKCQKNK